MSNLLSLLRLVIVVRLMSCLIDINIYLAYLIVLCATAMTYLYNSKVTLVNAYKNNYIETTIQSIASIFLYVGQIIILVLTQNFYLYLIMLIVSNFIHYCLISIYVNKKYRNILIDKKTNVNEETKKEIIKNVKAMFIHKLGSAIFNSIDSILISAILGVIILGKYSNYTSIMNAMRALIILFFVPLSSIVGHVCVKETAMKKEQYFNFFYYVNLIIGIVFHLGFYAVIQDLIPFVFGENLNLGKGIVMVFVLNYFIQFMRQCIYLFKDATGSFYYDRWIPLLEGGINLVLSIILGYNFGIIGVTVATIAVVLFIDDIVEPYILYKYVFKSNVKKYYLKNYMMIVMFFGLLLLTDFLLQTNYGYFTNIVINGFISIAISLIVSILFIIFNKNFRIKLSNLLINFRNKRKK